MNKISCNVCMDLLPLVKDGVASEDSCVLVKEHLLNCQQCRDAFGEVDNKYAAMDDEAVLSKIKKKTALFLIGLMIVATLFGMAISGGMGMFYNSLIMPVIGAAGYMVLRRRALFVPLGLFIFSFVWVAIREIAGGILAYAGFFELAAMSCWWASIFTAFSTVGVLIAWLLHFAFKKGV